MVAAGVGPWWILAIGRPHLTDKNIKQHNQRRIAITYERHVQINFRSNSQDILAWFGGVPQNGKDVRMLQPGCRT